MKKVIALVLCVVLSLSLFVGCGNNGGTTKEGQLYVEGDYGDTGGLKLPITKKGEHISILASSSEIDLQDSAFIQELIRRTGVDLEVIAVAPSTMSEKTKVMAASGDAMPDIFTNSLSWKDINDYGDQGAFEEITQHLDKLPNINEIFFKNAKEHRTEGAIASWYSAKGGLYLFPRFDLSREVNHGMLYRKDIFDKHGLKMWTNDEEFYQTLKKLKELYPNSTPFVSKNSDDIIGKIGSFSGIRFPQEYYDEEEQTWKYGGVEEKAKEIIFFLKKLYDEGLIDPEFLTCTQASWTAKMTQADKAFVTYDWIGRLEQFTEQTKETVPGYDLRYGEPLGEGKVPSLSQVAAGPVVKKSKNSLIALKLLDYLLSPSGAELSTLGVEGTTFNFNDEGKVVYVGFEDKVPSINELEETYGMFTTGLYMRMDRRSAYFNYTAREQEAQDYMNSKEDGYFPLAPAISFTEEENEEIKDIFATLGKPARETAIKIILNGGTEKDWEAWLKKAEQLGVNRAIEILNAAQARYNEKLVK